MNIQEMRQQRKALIDKVTPITAKPNLTDEEKTAVDSAMDQIEAMDKQIAAAEADARRQERLAKVQAESATESRRTIPSPAPTTAPAAEASDIRVCDNLPMRGVSRSFAAVFGERQGREAAYRSGMWFLANVFGNEQARQWSHDYGYRSALNNASNTAGAILVPDAIQAAVMWNVEERGVFARYAQRVPMGQNDVITVPKSTGEVTIYPVAENMADEVTASEPTFNGVELQAKTWGVLTRVGRNLAEDAVINIADYVAQKFGWAMADRQDECGFNGTGAGATYGGIHGAMVKVNDGNHAGSIYTAVTGNTSFGELDLVDFEGVVGKLPQWADGDDVAWYISKPGFYASMARLADAAGGTTKDQMVQGAALQFLGYPVRIVQVLNKTLTAQTSTVIAMFGSLRRAAALATKRDLSIQVLTEKYATYNQVGVLAFARWGINVHELGDGSNAGALIALKTPGS